MQYRRISSDMHVVNPVNCRHRRIMSNECHCIIIYCIIFQSDNFVFTLWITTLITNTVTVSVIMWLVYVGSMDDENHKEIRKLLLEYIRLASLIREVVCEAVYQDPNKAKAMIFNFTKQTFSSHFFIIFVILKTINYSRTHATVNS